MADSQMNKLLTGFVFLIIAVIFVGILAGANVDTWSKTVVVDEVIDISSARLGTTLAINPGVNLTIANPPTGYKIEKCPLTSITYGNSTADYTVTTDYTLSTTTGVLNLVNTATVNNTISNNTYVDYTYCSDNYLTLGWDRTMITTTYGLFALGAFGIALWLFYSLYKDSGFA